MITLGLSPLHHFGNICLFFINTPFSFFLLRLKISRILYNKKEVEDVANISSGYSKFPTLVNTNHFGEVLGFLSNSKEKNKGVSF